jgi:hypothetical protein
VQQSGGDFVARRVVLQVAEPSGHLDRMSSIDHVHSSPEIEFFTSELAFDPKYVLG